MTSPYTLSVLIPTYNTSAYLERCIDSLLDERINHKVEILIVNDGSTDNSLEIARRYEQEYPFVRVIDQPNGGYGSTLNAGIATAQGRYLRILDSDDWFETTQFVPFVLQLETENRDLVLTSVYLNKVYQNTEEEESIELMFKASSIAYGQTYTFSDFTFQRQFFRMGQMTYRTDILKQVPQKYQEKTFYVDNEFLTYPIAFVENFVFYDYFIYHYFLGRPGQSMSTEVRIRNTEHLKRVASALLDFYYTGIVQRDEMKRMYIRLIVLDILNTYYFVVLQGSPICWIRQQLQAQENELKRYPEFYSLLGKKKTIRIYRFSPMLAVLGIRLLMRWETVSARLIRRFRKPQVG